MIRVAPERRIPPDLGFSIIVAGIVVAAAFAARVWLSIPGETVTGESWLGRLLAAACWCAAALMVRRRETVAWLMAVGAVGLASFRTYGLLRTLETVLGDLSPAIPRVWPWVVPVAMLSLIAAAGVAAAYAARRRTTARSWVRIGVPAAAVVGFVAVVIAAGLAVAASGDVVAVRMAGRLGFGFAAVAALVGAGRDLAGPLGRAQRKLVEQPLTRRGATITIFARLLRDELFPTVAEERGRAIEEERARLAADLHALVLPELRRAAAAADAAGQSGSANLRNALADVEQLINARQSVVLEQFGLGAALEWLAERVEERSAVRVTIEEDDTSWVGVGNRTLTEHMAAARQRAAFRIALLALDNVVRHAQATTATIRFGAAPRQFLSVTDDGVGLTEAPTKGERAGRGLIDMRAEAVASGGNLEVTSDESGTKVEIAWGPSIDAPGARSQEGSGR